MNKPVEHAVSDASPAVYRHRPPVLNDLRIRVVRTEAQLAEAVGIRSSAYRRHHPEFARLVKAPEPADRHPDSIVLLAETQSNGEAVGTVRIQTNFTEPSEFERHLVLPAMYREAAIAHVSRLAVKPTTAHNGVRHALFKSLYRYCFATQVRWLMVGARPPMDRQFLGLGFRDVFQPGSLCLLPSSGRVGIRALAFDVVAGERIWRAMGHRHYDYMVLQFSPEIEIFSSVTAMWNRPRRARMPLDSALSDLPLMSPIV